MIMKVQLEICPKVLKRCIRKRLHAVGGLLVGQVIHSLKLKVDCKASLWTWKKDIVVAGNGIRLAYHVPMQFPAYSSIGKMLGSICISVFMSPHIRAVMSQ